MDILSFLANRAGRVYRFFDTLWGNADDFLTNLYGVASAFFRFTLPYVFNRLIDFIPNIVSLASWMFGTIIQIVTSMFGSLVMLVYSLFGSILMLTTTMFGTLITLVFTLYGSLSYLVFSLFGQIISLTTSLYGTLVTIVYSMFGRLTLYVFYWFSQASYIFNNIFGILLHLASSVIFGGINLLVSFLPMLSSLITIPFSILSYLSTIGFSMLTTGLSYIMPFVGELVNSVIPTIRSLFSVLPNLFSLTSGAVFANLAFFASDLSKGLPAITEVIKRNIENWIIDKFLDFFEKAIDRFW